MTEFRIFKMSKDGDETSYTDRVSQKLLSQLRKGDTLFIKDPTDDYINTEYKVKYRNFFEIDENQITCDIFVVEVEE